jgi:hypothetical protein
VNPPLALAFDWQGVGKPLQHAVGERGVGVAEKYVTSRQRF